MKQIAYTIIIFTLLLTLLGCSTEVDRVDMKEKTEIEAGPVEKAFYMGHDDIAYNVEIILDEDNRKIYGREEVFIDSFEDPQLIFNLWMKAYQFGDQGNFYFQELRDKIFSRGNSVGDIKILSVKAGDKNVPFEVKDIQLYVDLSDIGPHQRSVTIEFEITVPNISHRSGGNEKALWLGNWIPTLAMREEEWMVSTYTPAGDPFYTTTANYQVIVKTPKEYVVAGTGIEEEIIAEDMKITSFSAENVRDFALGFSKDYRKETTLSSRGIQLNIYSYSLGEETIKQYQEELKKMINYYENRVGEYPYEDFDVIETEFMTGGMEYPGLIMIDSQRLRDFPKGKDTILHELGHQWFYGILGNNQLEDPWFDEGLTTFIQKGYEMNSQEIDDFYRKEKERLQKDLEKYENTALGESIEVYTSWNHYYRVNYRKAALMHYEIYQAMGEENYDRFLKELYLQYQYKTISKEDFERFCIKYGGEKIAGIMKDYFEK